MHQPWSPSDRFRFSIQTYSFIRIEGSRCHASSSRADKPFFPQIFNDNACILLWGVIYRIQDDLRIAWCFIRVVDPGEALDFDTSRLFIKPFDFPFLTYVKRCIYEDHNGMISLPHQSTYPSASSGRNWPQHTPVQPLANGSLGDDSRTSRVHHRDSMNSGNLQNQY